MAQMVRHHVKYKEIHGVDETVMMTRSEHKKLHARLRREKKCNVPVETLHKISMAGNGRDERRIFFDETLAPNIRFREEIVYVPWTGNVTYSAYFGGNNGFELPVIDI